MVILFGCLLALLALFAVFLLSQVTVSVIYDKNFQKNEAEVKIRMWRGLLHYEKKVKIGAPVGEVKKDGAESIQEELSIDEMDGSLRVIAKSLTELKGYGSATKEITSDIQLTSLEISLSYGAGDAPKTAMATDCYGELSVSYCCHKSLFPINRHTKTEVIPYFMMKKPLELHFGCIGKVQNGKRYKSYMEISPVYAKKKAVA